MYKSIICNYIKYVSIFVILIISSCARDISSNSYSADHVGEASMTYSGTVLSIRTVIVEGGEQLQDNWMGMIGGGAAGAYGGSRIGKGEGNTLATVGGAILGATLGAFAEKGLKKQDGTEYIVQLDNGSSMTVVQGPSPGLSIGQLVYVIVGHKGRSRVIAR